MQTSVACMNVYTTYYITKAQAHFNIYKTNKKEIKTKMYVDFINNKM